MNSTMKFQTIKLKTITNGRRVHKVFFSTQLESETFINSILQAQSFSSQLDQYEI